MHVIITERLYDPTFIKAHTSGFEELSAHVLPFTPAWGAEKTGLDASQIISFAKAYASTRPAMILLGGSSMHKGGNGFQAARAISCLPALIGDIGLPGGGLGHVMAHSATTVSLLQVPSNISALRRGRTLMLCGICNCCSGIPGKKVPFATSGCS